MKKLTALLVVFMIVIMSFIPVMGEGIYVGSESGDKIRILEDTVISEPVSGNVVSVLGNVSVNNRVNGHVIAVFGDIIVDGEVTGQVVSLFGSTALKDQARIMGDVITVGPLSRSSNAVLYGQEVRIFGESMNLDIGALSYLRLIIMLLFTLAVFIAGLLALLISRKRYDRISKGLEKNIGRKLILGILAFIGASSLLLILLVTLIAPLFYIILLIWSSVPAFMYLGRMILKTFSQKNSKYAEFITGLVSITLIKLLIIFILPEQSIFLGVIIVSLLNIFIYSLGMGILMEQYYLKNNKAEPQKDKPESEKTEQPDGKSDPESEKHEPQKGKSESSDK